MIVLKIIGCFILGILILIILALSVKVKIFAEYSEVDTNVRVQWLFLKLPLYPSKKNDKKSTTEEKSGPSVKEELGKEIINETLPDVITPEETSTEDSATETTENTQTNTQKPKNSLLNTIYSTHGIDGLILIVKRVFRYIGTFLGDLMHSLVIDELYIDVMCNKNDAASTAIYYGEVCSTLFPMLGALVTKYKVRKYDINVYPDYLAKHSSASFAVSMHLYPIYVIGISVSLVIKLIFKVLLRLIGKTFLHSKKMGNENTKTDTEESVA
ncbi:MAG: DUF2953 domain-containing protein [Clostridia bacterium]|nr:DUF2953 domain-containing protein [Clostridia bacterium]